MHILIIPFQPVCETAFAPAFASVPGLLTKTWLSDTATNSYGGVYVWKDRPALAGIPKSAVFASVASHSNLTNITARDFASSRDILAERALHHFVGRRTELDQRHRIFDPGGSSEYKSPRPPARLDRHRPSRCSSV